MGQAIFTAALRSLLAAPARRALAEKRPDAFLRVGGEGVHRHDFLGVGVGLLLIEIDLGVECLLADGDYQRTGGGHFFRQAAGGGLQVGGGDGLVDEAPFSGCTGRHQCAGEQHLEGALAADGARQGDHRRGAEEPDLHAGRGEGSFLGGDGEIAGGHQLASGGRGDPLYLGDYGLRNGLQRLHETGADVEDAAVFIDVAAGHLGEIVAGAEDFARGGEDDGAGLAIAADFIEGGDEIEHQFERESVAALGTVQGNDGDGAIVSDVKIQRAALVHGAIVSHLRIMRKPNLMLLTRCTSTGDSVQAGFGGLQSPWMRLRWGLYLAILVAPALAASTIDVSAQTSAVVRTGDTLVFHVFTWNFGVNAAAVGLPVYPADVSFALVSAPLSVAGGFAATLESTDRAVSVAFGNLTFSPGKFQKGGHAGEVSTLEGYLHLSSSLSEALFGARSAVIALRNQGPDVTLGFAPYLLRQDLYTSLSGGPLSVGAVPGWVDLESPVKPASLINLRAPVSFAAGLDVPEPRSGGLLFGGGVLLCGLSMVLGRFSRARGEKVLPREKSIICIR